MFFHAQLSDTETWKAIRHKKITLGGHRQLKIYGHLDCTRGKKMKKQNRVFFSTETEAQQLGYRPCGHCMKEKYRNWKNGFIQPI